MGLRNPKKLAKLEALQVDSSNIHFPGIYHLSTLKTMYLTVFSIQYLTSRFRKGTTELLIPKLLELVTDLQFPTSSVMCVSQ